MKFSSENGIPRIHSWEYVKNLYPPATASVPKATLDALTEEELDPTATELYPEAIAEEPIAVASKVSALAPPPKATE